MNVIDSYITVLCSQYLVQPREIFDTIVGPVQPTFESDPWSEAIVPQIRTNISYE